MYTLLTNKGITYRILDMPAEALEDFFNASKLLTDVNKVRLKKKNHRKASKFKFKRFIA